MNPEYTYRSEKRLLDLVTAFSGLRCSTLQVAPPHFDQNGRKITATGRTRIAFARAESASGTKRRTTGHLNYVRSWRHSGSERTCGLDRPAASHGEPGMMLWPILRDTTTCRRLP